MVSSYRCVRFASQLVKIFANSNWSQCRHTKDISRPGVAAQNYPPLVLTPGGKNGLAHSYPLQAILMPTPIHYYPRGKMAQAIWTPGVKLTQFTYFLTLQY